MTLQLSPEVGQTAQEAFQRVGLGGQGIGVPSDWAEGVQLIVKVGESREDVAHIRLDLTHALQAQLQGAAAMLNLVEVRDGSLVLVSFTRKTS